VREGRQTESAGRIYKVKARTGDEGGRNDAVSDFDGHSQVEAAAVTAVWAAKEKVHADKLSP
jgi:hypothetical protein